MYCTMVGVGAWMMGHYPVAILAVAAASILGWPFAAAIGLPIAVDLLLRQKMVFMFIKWCVVALGIFAVSLSTCLLLGGYFIGHLKGPGKGDGLK